MSTEEASEPGVVPIASEEKLEPQPTSSDFTEVQPEAIAEEGEAKPWFLKTEDIYEVVKNAAADVKVGDVVLAERAITVVDGFALAISKKVLRVSEEEGFSIVQKMDELTVNMLRSLDVGVSVLSVKFVEAVGVLQAAVLHHAEWTSAVLKDKAVQAHNASAELLLKMQETEQYKALKTKLDPALGTVATAYGAADNSVRAFLTRVENDYPDATARIKSVLILPHPDHLSAASIYNTVNENVYQPAVAGATAVYKVAAPACATGANAVYTTTRDTAIPACVAGATTVYTATRDTAIPACVAGATTAYEAAKPACVSGATAAYNSASPYVSSLYNTAAPVVSQFMDRAQPYVHKAIETTSPYVEKVATLTKPVVDVAVDLSQPVVDKVAAASAPYINPALESPIVASTIANTYVAMETVKSYCDTNPKDADAEAVGDVADAVACPSSSGASSLDAAEGDEATAVSAAPADPVASEVPAVGTDEVSPPTAPGSDAVPEPPQDPVTPDKKNEATEPVPDTPASPMDTVDLTGIANKSSPRQTGKKKKGKKNKA